MLPRDAELLAGFVKVMLKVFGLAQIVLFFLITLLLNLNSLGHLLFEAGDLVDPPTDEPIQELLELNIDGQVVLVHGEHRRGRSGSSQNVQASSQNIHITSASSSSSGSATSNVHGEKISNEGSRFGDDRGRCSSSCHNRSIFFAGTRRQRSLEAASSFHKSRGRLMVDRGQRGNMTDQFIQQSRLDQVGLFRNQRLFGQNHLFCRGRRYKLTSGSDESNVTKGGANFLLKLTTNSASWPIISMYFMSTFTAESTTAALACAKRGVIRSQMD
ncbi:hypothetical protein TCAL_15197 [Tigriopus californicus]|uniref:Uncharacterized protein n=1 Tax=Tigriopus californicus TaxID=6832 RepID=A0A553NEC8_TIGCA|nr:hypothetical protein TCAL_15197 [Tigriopus californicus]